MQFRCAGIRDTTDGGMGLGLGVFFQGCHIHCKGCQNPDLQDPSGGYNANTDTIVHIVSTYDYYDSIVFLGGEPTEQEEALLDIASRVNIPCILFTGKYYRELSNEIKDIMYMIVDGPYIEECKTGTFPASYNQRIYINGKMQKIIWEEIEPNKWKQTRQKQ